MERIKLARIQPSRCIQTVEEEIKPFQLRINTFQCTVSNYIYQGAVFKATKIIQMKKYLLQASTQILTRNRIGTFLFESTLGPGFRKVCFRATDLPDPSGRSAQTHKTYAVSPKNRFHVDGP